MAVAIARNAEALEKQVDIVCESHGNAPWPDPEKSDVGFSDKIVLQQNG
jgi:hypothetical protein